MTDALTELLRTGAQELIATAVEAELASSLAQFVDVRTDAGHAGVVRNGHHPGRPFQTSIGPVSVRIPKVRSKDGTPVTFRSALVPPYVRRTKTLEAAALALPQRDFQRRNGRGTQSSSGSRCDRTVSEYSLAPQARLGQRIRRLERRCGG
jgi:transposase-like protein